MAPSPRPQSRCPGKGPARIGGGQLHQAGSVQGHGGQSPDRPGDAQARASPPVSVEELGPAFPPLLPPSSQEPPGHYFTGLQRGPSRGPVRLQACLGNRVLATF